MKTEIQVLRPDHLEDLTALISVFEKVFQMGSYERPGQAHLQRLLNTDKFFAVTAKAENKIIAGLTVYVLDQVYSERPLAYVYDLAVLTEYQRKGVGRQLIQFTNEFCRQKGFQGAFVQAEKADEYAIDFYRSTKPTEELEAMHFYYKLIT